MRRLFLLITFAAFLAPSLAEAGTYTVTVPPAGEAKRAELCAQLRIYLGFRPARWNDDRCMSQIARIGMEAFGHERARKAGKAAAREAEKQAVEDFRAGWPEPTAADL